MWRAIRTDGTCSSTTATSRSRSSSAPTTDARLDLTDEEIHERLPSALERHYTENRDDLLMVPGEQYNEASWDSPVRLLQNHFV